MSEQFPHLFLDAYGVDHCVSEDHRTMAALLRAVRALLFNGKSIERIVTVKSPDPQRRQNDGVSGVILAHGGHFTCHTFSNRDQGIIFVDACTVGDQHKAQRLHNQIALDVDRYFSSQRQEICRQDFGSGFGTHLVVNANHVIPYACAHHLIDAIVDTIDMTPLCERLERKLSGRRYDIMQPITESHIAIHSSRNHLTLDVFSCKPFDVQPVLELLNGFQIRTDDRYIVSRGTLLSNKTF